MVTYRELEYRCNCGTVHGVPLRNYGDVPRVPGRAAGKALGGGIVVSIVTTSNAASGNATALEYRCNCGTVH